MLRFQSLFPKYFRGAKWPYLTLTWVCSLVFQLPAHGGELVGRAILPADTFAPGRTTGQFKKTRRSVPFNNAQPVQGVSAIEPGMANGVYFVLSDNGFGSKSNSPDYVLRIYALQPDFPSGRVYPVNMKTGERLLRFSRRSFIELKDSQRQINFPIVADGSTYPQSDIAVSDLISNQRLLTGGDFDPESFRQVGSHFWIGDEFGPFLLKFNLNGELVKPPISIPNLTKIGDDSLIRSPDHPEFANLPRQEQNDRANLGGSRGIEGMAINTSGNKLYPMLEGAVVGDGAKRLLIYEFDLNTEKFTGDTFSYKLEQPNHVIGEITAINDREFIIIERDQRQGDPNHPGFTNPAQFKRLYKIDISKRDRDGYVSKELLVDLLRIQDPRQIGGAATKNGIFAFPFVTIESVLPIDAQTLMVVNDNNYADTIGRHPKLVDNTEFILIRLPQPLNFSRQKSNRN